MDGTRSLSGALHLLIAALASVSLEAQISLRVEADCLQPNVHEPVFLGVQVRNGSAEDDLLSFASCPFVAERFDDELREWTAVQLDPSRLAEVAPPPPRFVTVFPESVRVRAGEKLWACVQKLPLRPLTETAGRMRIKAVGRRIDQETQPPNGDEIESPWIELRVQAHADNSRLLDAPDRSESLWVAFNHVVFGERPPATTFDVRTSWSLVQKSELSERIKDCARLNHAIESTAIYCIGYTDPTARRERWLASFEIACDIDLDRYPREIGGVGYAALAWMARACGMSGDLESAAQFSRMLESRYPANVAFERGEYRRTPTALDRTDAPAQPK